MQLMKPTIRRINGHFQELFNESDDGSDGLANDPPPDVNLITAISTQMYNDFMHRAATQAGALDVVRGRISSALAAPPPSRATQKNCRMAYTLQKYCNLALPHTRFAERMQVPDCPTALHVESVYIIDMIGIPENKCDERCVQMIYT